MFSWIINRWRAFGCHDAPMTETIAQDEHQLTRRYNLLPKTL